ncbi:16S rRNA (uracil(1498)-N(3))-methyltransferase [Thermomonas sp.]|uniref:16S rRNA (uracil(1498)-N(3))-methyltransferase n=1 Tax=Thermomonas sp. TaxID=1971895 RepID=UPI00262E41B3|nr:16S rRNA (uracil(1498)-N(3))-methyltransferase [Thermomonas sp.]MCO5055027.1 16S rRNA (uracil(1498)-N(3))-methyltransferase [Thermomonas sp.]HRO63084.1 16S rRNA (uracil(1498)-N(3))-methyltransferase [Thermomonas sp.]
MRLTRCHLDQPLAVGTTAVLPEAIAQHLLRVLRLREGDACVLFNGDGHDCDARIVAVGKREARVEITARRLIENESPLRITLLQGIARGEKMDWIVQKATELGVARILPVLSERSEVRLNGERAERRLAHWREVAVSACEQSERALLPELAPPQPLAQAAGLRDGPGFVLDPLAEGSARSVAASLQRACTLAIGPEGGWSPRDLEQLRAAGFGGLRLGPRVLRTETAGIAAIAVLQALAGDLG